MADEFLNLLGKLIENKASNSNSGVKDSGINVAGDADVDIDSRHRIERYPRPSSNFYQAPSIIPSLDYFPEDGIPQEDNLGGYKKVNMYNYGSEHGNQDQHTLVRTQPDTDAYQKVSQPSSQPTPLVQPHFFQDNSIQHNSFFSAPVQRASEPVVDPSTITTYPNAVKYIVSTLSRNDYLMQKIKKLISHQNMHEEKWKQGRDQLVKRQQGRQAGKEKLESILKLVGGGSSMASSQKTEDQLAQFQNELDDYDFQIYNFLELMVKDMTLKLKSYGIPLFCIQESLITNKIELMENQKKVLDLLVDICN